MKAIEQYFHVVLFINFMLYNVVLTCKSVDETLVCDHYNESYWAILSRGTAQGGVDVSIESPSVFNVLFMELGNSLRLKDCTK